MATLSLAGCEPFFSKHGKCCTIHTYGLEDLDHIISIDRQASPYPWTRKNFVDSLSSSHICIGVRSEGFWLAHAVFSLAADEAELLILAVDLKHQAQGIATQFLMRMENLLEKHAAQIFLEVRESNFAAIGLYESLGFHRIGERLNYYPLPGKNAREHALIYAKYIGG